MECFSDIKITHVPRSENLIADVLANLATALAASGGQRLVVEVEERSVIPESYFDTLQDERVESVTVVGVEVAPDDWRMPFIDYLRYGTLPSEPRDRGMIRRRAHQFVYLNGTLYRK